MVESKSFFPASRAWSNLIAKIDCAFAMFTNAARGGCVI